MRFRRFLSEDILRIPHSLLFLAPFQGDEQYFYTNLVVIF